MKPSSGHWNGPSGKPLASSSSSLAPPGASGHGNASSARSPGASGHGNASSARSPGASGHGNASSADPLRISIIIPTLNEATTIEDCLGQFDCGSRALSGPDGLEIIVVDGGSDDGTAGIAGSCPGVRLVDSGERGRAVQMNAGAAASSGDVLLFLHADTRLPVRWRDLVTVSICNRGKPGGRFRFDVAHAGRIYRWIARGTNFRSRILGITYGDQAIYATREAFESVGGFPDIPVFEDARFADRLKQAGGLDWIDDAVLTSARRWERRGPVRTLLLTWFLRLLYTLFVPPRFLARFYGVVR